MRRQTDFRRDTQTVIWDIELSPRLGWYYGVREVTPMKEVKPPTLLSFAWKWLGEKDGHCLTLYDRKGFDSYDDKLLVAELWNVLDKCQLAIGHNSRNFDSKVVNSLFLKNNMTPPSPYKDVDTLQIARKYFRFENNKLDNLGKLLAGEGKTKVTYGDVWEDLMFGNEKEQKRASKLMAKYNLNDVLVTEKIYKKMLPWATNHPNMALYAGKELICPRCANSVDFKVKSYRRTGVQINAIQYQCKFCHAYVTRKLDKEEREELREQGKLTSIFRNVV